MANKPARGIRAKTRHSMRNQSKVTVNTLLRDIALGTRVQIDINGSIHSGMPGRRFQGKTGIVKEKRGRCYLIDVKLGNALNEVIANPAHLKVLAQPIAEFVATESTGEAFEGEAA